VEFQICSYLITKKKYNEKARCWELHLIELLTHISWSFMDIYAHYLDINILFVLLSVWGGVPTNMTLRVPYHLQVLQLFVLLNGSSRRLEKISYSQASNFSCSPIVTVTVIKLRRIRRGGACNSTSKG
jgi:hypothetical protein